ncbi:hypothetical protein L2764_12225 [Shewanella surugensis]|uniref:Lysozyme n=1 Tax=Shewanella surugensis TaxID=212020 RepID=A0ABT0LCK9_9GAMM|nr:hypothetical protein [Shewanella surugensis]MCL1125220.1 hypothetical protein [Shewanella surugensis]
MAISQRLMALGLTSAVALSGGILVAENEGLVLGTYLDPIGIVTSCYGHTGGELQLGQDFTEAQCLEQLAVDLSHHMSDYWHSPHGFLKGSIWLI